MTRALVVGAGGLGGPIALALAAWELTIFDADVVERSNLHRQIQFGPADVGAPKAATLAGRLPRATAIARRWTPDEPTAGCDLLIDASDHPPTKFAVCDVAVAAGLPYVIASALRYGGNVMVGVPGAACYRCLFEDVPDDAPSCASDGVLGPVVGAIGGLAAALARQLAAGDLAHAGTLVALDDLRTGAPPRFVRFARRAGCATCATDAMLGARHAELSRPHRPA